MDSSVDITPEELQAMGDVNKESSSDSGSKEHEFVKDIVNKNRIVIFSKTKCPYCNDSKTLLTNMGVAYKLVELDEIKEGTQVQQVLGKITDAKTVPRIFIDGQCVGGNSDLKSLNNEGTLKNMIYCQAGTENEEDENAYTS